MTRYKQNNLLRCIQLLLDNHANVNIQDEKGLSCIFYARIECVKHCHHHLDIVRLPLLNSNIDANLQLLQSFGNNNVYMKGDTLLHFAVKENDIEIVNMILECYFTTVIADILLLIKNSNHETSYDIAKLFHHEPIMECLKMTLEFQCHIFIRQKWIIHNKKQHSKGKNQNLHEEKNGDNDNTNNNNQRILSCKNNNIQYNK